MDNIKVEKIYSDFDLFQIKVTITSEFVSMYQFCYIGDEYLNEIGNKILSFSFNAERELYVEFGNKVGNYTPAFSFHFLKVDKKGHVRIEVDMEIADDTDEEIRRKHRASFYVYTELGLVENFGKGLVELSQQDAYMEIVL